MSFLKYGLIGERLGHSFSKVIHESFAPYEYELCELDRFEVHEFMKKHDFKAVNVTIPYKETVIEYLSYIDEAAKKIGSVNTIVNRDGKLFGYNTDFFGFKRLLERNGFELKNKKVLILGSGGTAKTAFAASESLGAREVIIVSRSGKVNYKNVKEIHGDASYIINTTPCGMFPQNDTSAITLDGFSALEGVADVVYNPLETKLIRQARQLGLKHCCGLYMLVAQAVKASEIFLDTKYDSEVYEKTFRSVLSLKQNIVLVGMPGCGKSTIGKALAKKLNREFVDTDELIIKNEGKPIPEIFKSFGEKYFRDAETKAIKEASSKNCLVIATGGGAVLRKENIDALSSNGKIFFLNRPVEDILPTGDRPLSSNMSDLKKRFDERYPIYKSVCDEEIFVDGVVSDSVDKIINIFI